jgi:S1-C subfamily serine protease
MAPTQTPATPMEEPPTATVLAPTPTVQDEPPVPAGLLSDLQTEVQAVYQSVGKSVVNISVVTISYDFFTNPVPQEGAGSGFVYDDEGHVVTNYHVVAEADSIQVFFADGTSTAAEVVGSDPTYDLAVLELEDADEFDLDPIPIGDSDQLVVGEFVVAVGSPFGLEQSLTFGVISSLGRIIESPNGRYIGEAIQTDAAINPGNSGGPLLDLKGRIIGVNAQIVSPSRASAGIGFAIPANIVRRVVPELITLGRYRHPWMGIRYFPYALTPRLAKQFRELDIEVPDHGLLILDVEPGSPADESGLQGGDQVITLQNVELPVGGDVIIAVDGESINRAQDLIAYLETETQIGDTIQVTIIRDGEEMTLSLTLGERPFS